MQIKKILFVTKFEGLCFDALTSLLALRKADLEHIVFLYVIERDKIAMHRGSGYLKDEEIRLKETANIRFIDWAENLFEMGMEVGAHIDVGTLVPQIIKTEQEEAADLIVIGRSHKGPLEQLYARSDVTELIRRATKPVLVFKHTTAENMMPGDLFSRPLLATNWSPASLRTVEYLKRLKNVLGELNVVHVANEKDLKGSSTHDVQMLRKKERKRLDALCREFETHGIDARPHVYIGEPVKEIEKAAREYQASMIFLGSSGKAAFLERWTGSITKTIAEKSAFPTFLVPPETKAVAG